MPGLRAIFPHAQITASGLRYDSGCDHTVSLALQFSGGRTANLNISVETAMPNDAYVLGTKGTCYVDLLPVIIFAVLYESFCNFAILECGSVFSVFVGRLVKQNK